MHYFRVPRAYWGDRFAKMRAAGFNCVETVMCWNLHEPHEGEFCFGGGLDIAAYCRTAAEYGLYVIIRPGPYTCGEWDFGGFPAWLLADGDMALRTSDERYLRHVRDYYKVLMPYLAPLQITQGGPVLYDAGGKRIRYLWK